jgi:hypothetical protein
MGINRISVVIDPGDSRLDGGRGRMGYGKGEKRMTAEGYEGTGNKGQG